MKFDKHLDMSLVEPLNSMDNKRTLENVRQKKSKIAQQAPWKEFKETSDVPCNIG